MQATVAPPSLQSPLGKALDISFIWATSLYHVELVISEADQPELEVHLMAWDIRSYQSLSPACLQL